MKTGLSFQWSYVDVLAGTCVQSEGVTEVGFAQALDLEGGLGARRMSVPVKEVSPKDSHYLV